MIKAKGMYYLAASITACVSLSACSSAPTANATSDNNSQIAIEQAQAAQNVQLNEIIASHAAAFPTCVANLQRAHNVKVYLKRRLTIQWQAYSLYLR